MTDHRDAIDTTLERTLGSATLSPEQRRRHLNRIAARASRRRHGLPLRLLRDGGVAIVLVAIMIATYTMLPVGESPEPGTDPLAAIVGIRDGIADPEPGTARYTQVEGVAKLPPQVLTPEFSAEVWERVTEDGMIERAVRVYSPDGELLGRIIETADGWITEAPGYREEGRQGEPILYPPEMFQPLSTVYMTTTEQLIEELDLVLEDPNVTAIEEDRRIVVTVENPGHLDSREYEILGEQTGMTVSSWYFELTLDSEANQMVRWRWYVEDEQGERHDGQTVTFDVWEEIDPSDIPEKAFAERTGLPEIEVPLPERIELSIGTLEIRDTAMRSRTVGNVTYRGPAPVLIEVSLLPAEREMGDGPDSSARPIEIDGVSGYWHRDPNHDWPRTATWADSERRFTIHARNLPDGGWTEDDLYEVIEAIMNHGNG